MTGDERYKESAQDNNRTPINSSCMTLSRKFINLLLRIYPQLKFPPNNPPPSKMAAKDFKTLFQTNSFVDQYKTGEKITGKFARSLIEQSGILTESKTKSQPARPLVVLDSACGTGVVSSILHHELDERVRKQWSLTCGDFSEPMLKYTRARAEEEGWLNVEVKNVDVQETGLPSGQFSYVFTAFGTSDLISAGIGTDFLLSVHGPSSVAGCFGW